MRIAMVQPRLDQGGGAERVVAALTMGLMARGHEVTVFTDRYDAARFAPAGLAADAVEVVKSGLLGRLIDSKLLSEPSVGRRLGKRLAAFDLVVIHNSRALRWIGATGDLPPVLWYCHEPSRALHARITDPELLALAEREGEGNAHLREEAQKLLRRATKSKADLHRRRDATALNRVTRVTANSAYTAGRIQAIFDRPCTVCRPGVAVPDEGEPLEREGFVLAVGPVTPLKNVHNVVEAVCRLDESGRATRLTVVGSPDAILRATIRKRGAKKLVTFTGRATDEELDRLYRTCALLAYVPVGEPFGLVAIEAMARGAPVVASAYGGPAESVADRETGLLANPFDPQDIAAKLALLLGNDSRRQAMGIAARRRYETAFTEAAFLDRFEAECGATVEA